VAGWVVETRDYEVPADTQSTRLLRCHRRSRQHAPGYCTAYYPTVAGGGSTLLYQPLRTSRYIAANWILSPPPSLRRNCADFAVIRRCASTRTDLLVLWLALVFLQQTLLFGPHLHSHLNRQSSTFTMTLMFENARLRQTLSLLLYC
jgi:hypothetical protein